MKALAFIAFVAVVLGVTTGLLSANVFGPVPQAQALEKTILAGELQKDREQARRFQQERQNVWLENEPERLAAENEATQTAAQTWHDIGIVIAFGLSATLMIWTAGKVATRIIQAQQGKPAAAETTQNQGRLLFDQSQIIPYQDPDWIAGQDQYAIPAKTQKDDNKSAPMYPKHPDFLGWEQIHNND